MKHACSSQCVVSSVDKLQLQPVSGRRNRKEKSRPMTTKGKAGAVAGDDYIEGSTTAGS